MYRKHLYSQKRTTKYSRKLNTPVANEIGEIVIKGKLDAGKQYLYKTISVIFHFDHPVTTS